MMVSRIVGAAVAALLLVAVWVPVVAQESRPKSDPKPTTPKAEEKKAEAHPGLTDPSKANATAPEKFRVKFTTTKGDFVIEVTRDWAPIGADRFYNLVKIGYFQDIGFFRVMSGFMAQFGIHGEPSISRHWKTATIKDDPVKQSNKRGFISYAKTGAPNSRSTQFFINFADNSRLDSGGFAPFGRVVEGMEVVDSIYKIEQEPQQPRIQAQGNEYLKQFKQLDYIKSAMVLDK